MRECHPDANDIIVHTTSLSPLHDFSLNPRNIKMFNPSQ